VFRGEKRLTGKTNFDEGGGKHITSKEEAVKKKISKKVGLGGGKT